MCELNKVEAMELIKGIVGSKVCAMYYNKKKGISSKSKKIGKRRVEKNIQNAKTITYSGSEYIRKIELHGIKGKFKFSPCSSIVILFWSKKIEQKFENVKLYLFIGTIKWYNQIHKRTNVLIFNRHWSYKEKCPTSRKFGDRRLIGQGFLYPRMDTYILCSNSMEMSIFSNSNLLLFSKRNSVSITVY